MSLEEIFLIIFYSGLLSFLILRLKFFNRFHLNRTLLVALFLIRVLTGIFYGWIHIYCYKGGDTLVYFNDSLIAVKAFSVDPLIFFKLLFGINHRPANPLIFPYAHAMESWTDMSSYFIVRLNILLDVLSFNHYYVNVLIYDFFTFTGLLYLYRFFADLLPDKKMFLLFVIFIFPSVAFWSAGLHKDGISMAAIGLILFHAQKLTKQINYRILFGLLLGCILLMVVRDYLLFLLIPAVLLFIISKSHIKFSFVKAMLAFFCFYFLLFNLKIFFPNLDFLKSMEKQQVEFLHIIPKDKILDFGILNGSFLNLVHAFPIALKNCFLIPPVNNISSALQIPFALDNWILLLLIPVSLLLLKKRDQIDWSVILFCLLFSLSIFWLVGSIVPNLGALVRYKMPGMCFFFIALISIAEPNKLFFIKNPIKNQNIAP
ncbi:MAG: hypothetical protein H0W62_11790 [Chitinophagales bacterium]|nr:hypothetical protein [Chitinophagales bacterium]